MTPEQREAAIARHDELVRAYSMAANPPDSMLEEIAILEVMIFNDPDQPEHEPCEFEDCMICMAD